MDIHVYVHSHEHPDRVAEKLDHVLHAVAQLATKTKEAHMAVSEQIQKFSDQFNTATNEIAADLQALRDKVTAGTQLSAEDQAVLDASISRLTAMGVDPENPVPAEG